MASIRLNNSMRSAIKSAALAHRFATDIKGLNARGRAAARAIYNAAYDLKQREMMQSLPKGWLQEANRIYISFRGSPLTVYMNGETWSDARGVLRDGTNKLPEFDQVYVRVPNKDYHRMIGDILIPPDSEMGERLAQLDNDKTDLREQLKEAHTKLTAALNSVTTLGALISSYPSLEPFTKGFGQPTSNLPAVRRSELDALLDLPVT